MQDNEKKPALRFKGFTDPWEQRKLTNLCEKFTDGDWIEAKDQSDSGVRLVQTGNVGVTEYLDKPNNKKWISFETFEQLHCEEVYPGDILISRLPEPAGRACIMPNLGTKMITAVDCTIVRPNAVTSTRFLLQYLSSQAYFDAVNTCLAGGTRQRISRGNLAQFNVPIPSSKIEQEKIGEVLEKLDTLITLHQRKYEKLVNIKKSMLDKMFPKNGASVPEIRFKGFTDPWEQRKFSDITFPAGEKNRDNLPLESYSITNEHGFIPQDEKFENGGTMREADKRMYYIVSPNSFAYNPARINVGSIGYQNTGKDVIVSSLYEVFKTSDDVDDRLLWHWFKSPDFQKLIFQLQEGGVRLYFYYDKLCMGTVSLPSLEEQRKIGQFFDSLDTLITLHQRKLEKLQNIKKSCLEKMFV